MDSKQLSPLELEALVWLVNTQMKPHGTPVNGERYWSVHPHVLNKFRRVTAIECVVAAYEAQLEPTKGDA